MVPRIESVHRLPRMEENEGPQSIALDVSQGVECVIVGCPSLRRDNRVVRINIASDTCEAFPIKSVSRITDVAVAPKGGCYLVDDHKSIRRLDDRMATVASTTSEPDSAVMAVEAAGDGFVAVLARKEEKASLLGKKTRVRHSLVRYSDSLEQEWSIDLGDDLVSSARGQFPPVIPLLVRGAERYCVAAALDRASLFEIRGPLEAFTVHDIPTSVGPVSYEGAYYGRQPVKSLPIFLDACSRPSDDAVLLVDWGTLFTEKGERATGFYDCRYDENLSGFHTGFSVIEGSFLWVTALANNRVAAIGRLTFSGDWVVAVIKLPNASPKNPHLAEVVLDTLVKRKPG